VVYAKTGAGWEPGRGDGHLHPGSADGHERDIDATYGRLAQDAEDQDRGLLDAYDAANNGRGHVVGTTSEASETAEDAAA
jgi:hypothetical protein